MPGFIAWGAMLVGHYAVWSGKGGKVVANAMESIEKFYDKNLDKKIKRLLNINGIRKEVKITRNDERGVFKLKFDDVSIFDPSNFDEDAKSYDRNEDDMEIVDEAKGELKSDNSGISQNDKKIDYYTIELTLKDPNKLETLKLGEVDFCDWEKIFDIKIVSKETGKIVEKGSEEYSNLLDTLDNYAKFTASKGLPNDNLKDKVAVNNDTPIVGAFVNIWNAWIKGQIVKEKIDLEGNEDGNKHIKSLDFLESMGELLNDENEQEILDRYYKSVTRDLENQKRIMEKVRDKYHKEIQNRKKERNKAKLKLALIIIGSVLVIAGVIALAATVLPAAVGGTVAGSILTAAVGGVVAVIKGGIKSLFSFPIFGVATASLVAGIFTKGRSDYKKQRLDNAIKNENEANNVIKEIDEGIDEIKKDKKQVLENIDCIKRHEEVCLDVNSPSFGICLPKLLENIGLIKGLSIKGIDICQKNNKKISELIVKKLNNLLKQANLSADSKLTKLEFDCKFSDLSKENQEKLLRYAQGNFLFKEICFLEIGSDNILEDNNTFKELQRLCEINKYLSGDIKFDNGDYPKQYFSSQEDWYQAILKRLEDNYGWGIENKFNIDESIMNKFQEITVNSVKLCDQVEIYKNRNELLKELSDYSKKVDESKGILNKIFDRVSGKLQADELKNYFSSLNDKLKITFLIKYQRGLKYLNITAENIFNWIDDNKLLKSYVSAIDFKFSELSETNQERLLSLAKNDFTFKEFKCLEESDDKLKELQRLCEINKYLSGDIKLDSSDYPSECFSSQEDWYQAILKRLEDNYDWGVENKFVVSDDVIEHFIGVKFKNNSDEEIDLYEQVKTYQSRNYLMDFFEIQDYKLMENRIEEYLNDGDKTDDDRLVFYCNYWRAIRSVGVMPTGILELIKDSELLKECLNLVEQEDKDQFLEYVGFNRAEQELLDGVLNLEDLLENEEKFSEWIENFIEHSDWGDGLKFKFWNEIIRNIDNVSEEIKLQIEKIARVFIDHLVEMEGYSEIQKCFRDNALWFIRLITDIQDPKDVNELKSWLEKGDKLVNVKMRDFETNEEYVQEWLELKEIIIEKVNDMIEPKSIDELKPWLDLGKSYNNPTGIVTKKIEKIIKGMSVSSNIGEVEQWLMLLNEYPNHRSLIENKINNIINRVRIANINELKQWVELKEKFDDFEALKIKVNNYSPDGDTLLDICSNWKIVGKLTSKEKLHDKIRAALWIKTGVFGGRYNSLGAYFDALGKVNTKDFLKKIGFTTVEQYLFIELSSLSDNQDDKLSQKILEYMGCFFDWTTVANKKKDILKIIESDLNRHLIKDEMLDEDLRDVVEKSKSIEVGVKLFGEYFDEWSSTFENLNRCLSMLSGVNNLEDMVGKLRNIALSDKQKELLKQVLVDHCNKLITTDNSNYVEIMKLIDNFKQISIEIVNSQPAFGEPILSWRRFNDLVSSNDELSLLVLSSVKIKSCVVNTEERGKMIRKFKLLFDKQRNNLDNFATFVQQIKNLNRDWLKFLLGNQSGDENQLNKLCILIKVWYEVNHPVVLDNQINEKIFDGIYKGLGLVDEGVVDIDEIIGDLINKDLMVMAKVGNVEANKVLQKLNEEFQLSIDLEVNKNGN